MSKRHLNPPTEARMSSEKTDSVEIRRANEADLAAMVPILEAVVAPGDTLAYSEPASEVLKQWFGGDQTPWVAVIDGRVRGMYVIRANRSGRGSHVANATYAVDPSAQGQGIGRALVKHSLEQARASGFLAMQFNYVVSTNRGAVALYESLGFAIVGTLPKAFRHESLGLVDAYVMYRFL